MHNFVSVNIACHVIHHIINPSFFRYMASSGVASSIHSPYVVVDHGDKIEFGSMVLEVRATPGHTNGCVSYVCGGMVFTGDTLMVRGCGRTDFQEGSSAALFESVRSQIFTLPDDTVVYPARPTTRQMSSSDWYHGVPVTLLPTRCGVLSQFCVEWSIHL